MHFNHLMNIGNFPSALKIGKISPIYKKDDEELLQNYRPVSTLPIFGKIFEKIIYTRLYGFLSSRGFYTTASLGLGKVIQPHMPSITQSIRSSRHSVGVITCWAYL